MNDVKLKPPNNFRDNKSVIIIQHISLIAFSFSNVFFSLLKYVLSYVHVNVRSIGIFQLHKMHHELLHTCYGGIREMFSGHCTI